MARVTHAPLALRDLGDIWDYIAIDSIAAADRFLDRIDGTCELLARHKDLGQLRSEIAAGVRSFVVGNYVLFYRSTDDGIELARVIHAARDVDALF